MLKKCLVESPELTVRQLRMFLSELPEEADSWVVLAALDRQYDNHALVNALAVDSYAYLPGPPGQVQEIIINHSPGVPPNCIVLSP